MSFRISLIVDYAEEQSGRLPLKVKDNRDQWLLKTWSRFHTPLLVPGDMRSFLYNTQALVSSRRGRRSYGSSRTSLGVHAFTGSVYRSRVQGLNGTPANVLPNLDIVYLTGAESLVQHQGGAVLIVEGSLRKHAALNRLLARAEGRARLYVKSSSPYVLRRNTRSR